MVAFLFAVSLTAWMYREELVRVMAVMTLFEPDRIVENFRSMDRIFETVEVRAGEDVWELPPGNPITLPESFDFGGERMNTAEFLEYTYTTGLMVLPNDQVVFEEYYLGETPDTRHISWSVAKSFTSALVGIAIDHGHIADVMDPVTNYVPELSSSGYAGVPLKDMLQMSSGVGFNEDYGDFYSDINLRKWESERSAQAGP